MLKAKGHSQEKIGIPSALRSREEFSRVWTRRGMRGQFVQDPKNNNPGESDDTLPIGIGIGIGVEKPSGDGFRPVFIERPH